jgi:molybdopterin/thiamine biosynthesis adenylyltransferase
MKQYTELDLLDEKDFKHSISQRNQRAYFGRIIRCSCGEENTFQSLPYSCEYGTECSPEFLLSRPSDWWNQSLLENSNVLLIGCGAIGNEIAKNLVLLGVKNLTLVDFDKIEIHNLNRSICFNSFARENTQSDYKVDVMKTFLESIDPSVNVDVRRTGVLDHVSRRKNRHKHWPDAPLDRNALIRLGLDHDVCIVCTDGMAPKSFIAGVLYLVCPIVQTSMNASGTLAQIRVSLPGMTGCVQCPTVETPVSRQENGEPDWFNFDVQYGANNCKLLAQTTGAASFAHTNSMAASFAVTQSVLIMKGWKEFLKTMNWPKNIQLPLWNEVAKPRILFPGGPPLGGNYIEELALEKSQSNDLICFCCRDGFVDGGPLFLRAIELLDISEEVDGKLWFDNIDQIPRLKNHKGFPKPSKKIRFGVK